MARVARRSCLERIARVGAAFLLGAVVMPLQALELRVLSAGAVEPAIVPEAADVAEASIA